MSVQTSFTTYPGSQFIGTIAHPNEAFAIDTGVVYLTGSDREPQPGDVVHYDTTNNGWRVPGSDANLRVSTGIVVYGPGEVPNASGTVEYGNDEEIWVCVAGVVWVRAGGSVDYGDRVVQDTHSSPDYKWDADNFDTSVSTTANLRNELTRATFRCVSYAISDGDAMKVRITGGGAG